MPASMATYVILGLALMGGLKSVDKPQQDTTYQLRLQVEERERQLALAQCQLAEARARLAQAEGRSDVAASELRKAVNYYQSAVQWLLEHANRFCDPRERLEEANFNLAKASIWLAEVEDTDSLVTQLTKMVSYQ